MELSKLKTRVLNIMDVSVEQLAAMTTVQHWFMQVVQTQSYFTSFEDEVVVAMQSLDRDIFISFFECYCVHMPAIANPPVELMEREIVSLIHSRWENDDTEDENDGE